VGAIDYALERWAGLTLSWRTAVGADTNIVERIIRQISIGKKNSLFCGNDEGASYCSPHHVLQSSKFCCRGQATDAVSGAQRLTGFLSFEVSAANNPWRSLAILVAEARPQ